MRPPAGKSIQIRDARPQDLDALRDIYLAARRVAFHWLDTSAWTREDFDRDTQGELVLVAANDNGEIRGFASSWEPERFVHHLYIAPDHTGAGVGGRLLSATLHAIGLPARLKCLVRNERALTFYRNRGWDIAGSGAAADGEYYELELNRWPSRDMDIRVDDLTSPQVIALLREHLTSMALYSPPESIHALDLDGLRHSAVTLWSAWSGTELLGCGALKALSTDHGEIKSMRTAAQHLRRGVATALLARIIQEAQRRGYRRLSLETGAAQAFGPARSLYLRHGFEYCGPFVGYVEDPYSVFMTRLL